jgi:predicted DNA-binding transcriptional regulator AlpA
MNYYSVSEAALLLNYTRTQILIWVKQGKLPGSFKLKNEWKIPKDNINKLAIVTNIPDREKYITLQEAIERLNNTKSTILRWLNSGAFPGAILNKAKWLIPMVEVEYIEQNRLKLDAFLNTQQLVQRFSCHEKTVIRLIKDGNFPNVIYKNGYLIPESDVIQYEKNISVPEGYLITEEVAKIFSLSSGRISVMSSKGEFPGAYKIKNRWVYPGDEVQSLFATRQEIVPVEPYELFKFYTRDIIKPFFLQKTFDMYHEFVLIKLSASRASHYTLIYNTRIYANTLQRLVELLSQEIYKMTNEQVKELFFNKSIMSSDKSNLVLFLDYCQGTVTCKFDKKFKETRILADKDKDIYSAQEFMALYHYVRDIGNHFEKALNNRKYAVTWVFILMHLIDAWRPSDVMRLPNIPIEILGISSFDEIKTNEISVEKARNLVNQVASRIERMYISKTGAMAHFLVNQDMLLTTATALTIAELHRRNIQDEQLLRFYDDFKDSSKRRPHRDTHLKPFFMARPDLLKFQSIKMNRTLLTYFFYGVTSGRTDSSISYDLSQLMRSHEGLDTTETYIQATNKDGSLDRVSLNLFNRGHFGWLYNFLVNTFVNVEKRNSMEQQTTMIQEFRKKYSPGQAEGFSYFLKSQYEEKVSLALRIASMPKEKLQTTVDRIFRGEMPAKIQNAQCFIFPDCRFPTATSCTQCPNIIPKTYLLISIGEEINQRIMSIEMTSSAGIRLRDSTILYKMLDLLSQAKIEFGSTFINQFINLTALEFNLNKIQYKILLE